MYGERIWLVDKLELFDKYIILAFKQKIVTPEIYAVGILIFVFIKGLMEAVSGITSFNPYALVQFL